MKKYISEQGFLTEDGKNLVNKFSFEADEILKLTSNENELRLIGSILNSIIGNKILSKIKK